MPVGPSTNVSGDHMVQWVPPPGIDGGETVCHVRVGLSLREETPYDTSVPSSIKLRSGSFCGLGGNPSE